MSSLMPRLVRPTGCSVIDTVTGVESIKTFTEKANGACYNLAGQKVDSAYKGVVIQNGKKMIQK